MNKREIKYKAWIPDLGIMLDDITIYGNGDMGYDEDKFKAALPKNHELDYDYFNGYVTKEIINKDGEEDFEYVLPVLTGEDWIWIDESKFIPLQYTGKKLIKGNEVYDGTIVFDEVAEESGDVRYYYVCVWIKEWCAYTFLSYGELLAYEDNGIESFDRAWPYNLEGSEKMHYAGHILTHPELLQQNP